MTSAPITLDAAAEDWLRILIAAAEATPPLARAIGGLLDGHPKAQRVRELLEEHGASERAADTLRTGEAPK